MPAKRSTGSGQTPKRKRGSSSMQDAAWTLFDVARLGRNKGRRESNTLSDAAKTNSKAKRKRKTKTSGSTYA